LSISFITTFKSLIGFFHYFLENFSAIEKYKMKPLNDEKELYENIKDDTTVWGRVKYSVQWLSFLP